MKAFFNLQDQHHPLGTIYDFIDQLGKVGNQFPHPSTPAGRNTPSSPMFTIDEETLDPDSPVEIISEQALQEKFNQFEIELDKKILSAHQHYYEDYKYLILYLSYFITADESKTPNALRHIFLLSTYVTKERDEKTPNIQSVIYKLLPTIRDSSPHSSAQAIDERERPNLLSLPVHSNDDLIKLIVACYLYHLSLERVYFKWLGAVHDPIAEKLFSQGLVLFGLISLCRHEASTGMYQNISNCRHEASNGMYQNISKILSLKKQPLAIAENFYLDYGKSTLKPIRAETQKWNLMRLFLGRLRRLMLCINALNLSISLQMAIQIADPFIQTSLGMLNFLFFIPRLLSFIGPGIKHLWAYLNATENDKQIGFWARLEGQFHRRWEMIFRDLLWFANGFMGIFVFTGVIGFVGLYFGAAMQFLEVCLNLYLLMGQKYRKNAIIDFFDTDKRLKSISQTESSSAQHDAYTIELHKRMSLENENGERRLFNSSLILLSNLLILPCFMGVSVFIPLSGAILAIGMTIVQYYYNPIWAAKLEHPPAFPLEKSFSVPSKMIDKTHAISSNLNLQAMNA